MSKNFMEKTDKSKINSISNQVENERKMESFIIHEKINQSNCLQKKNPCEKKVSFSRFKQIQTANLKITDYPLEDDITLNSNDTWKKMDENEKITYMVFSLFKLILISLFVYVFMISLSLLTTGIILISNSGIKSHPLIRFATSNSLNSFAIVIILTALLQNSTVVLLILTTFTISGILDYHHFASSCMGCYIGALIKNLFITSSFKNTYEFKQTFRAAAINQGFHLITTFILLPLELSFGFIFRISKFFNEISNFYQFFFLNDLISQFMDSFIILNKKNAQICCDNQFEKNVYNHSIGYFEQNNMRDCLKKCNYLCLPMIKHFGDVKTGTILAFLAIISLFITLFAILKVFSSFLNGPLAQWVILQLSYSVSKKFKWICHMVLFFCSIFIAALLQNSDSFTSTLINLYQLKVISFDKTYVMTLGSNLGAVFSLYLLAFIQPSAYRSAALHLAIINNLYMLLGTIFWLPLSNMRLSKLYADFLVNLVSKYKWIFIFYTSILVFFGPLFILGLALIKPYWIALVIVELIVLFIVIIKFLDSKRKYKYFLSFLKEFFSKIYHKLSKKSEEKRQLDVSIDSYSFGEISKIETSSNIMVLFRKLNTINSLIKEGIQFSDRNISENHFSDENSDDESFHDQFETNETRHGVYIFSNSSFSNVRDVTSTPN